jgi:hypothetical protein
MKQFFDAIIYLLEKSGIVDQIKQRITRRFKRIGPAWIAKGAAYFFAPGIILGIVITYGGGLAIDFGKGLAVSELQTEISKEGTPSLKKGIVVIAESPASAYKFLIENNSSKIWSSLEEKSAENNRDLGHFKLNGLVLDVKTPFFDVNDPVVMLIEGDVNEKFEVQDRTELIKNWGLISRNSTSIVAAVLINCFFALGIGLAAAMTPIDGNKNNAGKVGAQPDEEGIIQGDAIECKSIKIGISPGSQTDRKKVPGINEQS